MKSRKLLSLLIAALFVVSAVFIPAEAKTVVTKTYTDVALGCSYISSDPMSSTESGMLGYYYVDGHELTDGVYGYSSLYGTDWVGYGYAQTYYIILDLGSTVENVERFNLVSAQGDGDGINHPKSISYSWSADGTNYTRIGESKIVQRSGSLSFIYDYELILDDGVNARYIRADIVRSDSYGFSFFTEFEVGVPNGETVTDYGEPDGIRVVGNSKFFIDGSGYLHVPDNTDAGDIADRFGTEVAFSSPNGIPKTGGELLTGDIVTKTADGKAVDTVTVVVDGDVDANGAVEAADYLMIKRFILGSHSLSGANLAAAAVTGEQPATIDYVKVKRHVLGTYDIFEKYEDEPLLYDQDMTFTMTSSVLYTMSTAYNGLPYRLTFDKKDWGTWNIGTVYYNNNAIAGGGTDWEYVYRVDNGSGGVVFSGGNHGLEELQSFKIFNAETGIEQTLSAGQSFTAKGITIVEKTHLYVSDPSDYYAEVTRTYRIAGTKITLDVNTHYVKKTVHYLSYTCMFPVYKTYGRHSRIFDINGTYHDNYTTDGTVYPAYSDVFDDNNSSLRVVFWGDSQPTWKFDVRVYTPYDSVANFANSRKTMLWDMNTVSDKLYFSKYEESTVADDATVEPGTNYGTRSSWEFFVGGLDDLPG